MVPRRMRLIFPIFCFIFLLSLLVVPATLYASGATTTLHIVKYNPDGKTVKAEKTVDYKWMMSNLPVQGDGVTHYYHQGPVFDGDVWDPTETINLKDKGAVKGTAARDLCDLVGGGEEGGEILFKAVDGYTLNLAYDTIYNPPDILGKVALCWYKGPDTANAESREYGYPADDEYNSAMQIIIMAGTTNAKGQYVFGNQDMKIALPEEKYQHFYDGLPSTNGLSGKWISEIRIYSKAAPPQPTDQPLPYSTQTKIPWQPLGTGVAGVVLLFFGIVILVRKNRMGLLLLVTGIVLIGLSAGLYFLTSKDSDIASSWKVTVVGTGGQQKVLSYKEIKALPAYSGSGGFFTTTGVVNGPYRVKGVALAQLCSLVGGLQSTDLVKVSAADGYSTVLDYGQVNGKFITYDPLTLKEKSHKELKPVLMFEQDGLPLSEDSGKPLRLGVVGSDGLLTEGLYWIKWINKIEVIQPGQSSSGGP